MDLVSFTAAEKAAYSDEMLRMMQRSDREFVPPLSSRASTTEKHLSGHDATGNVLPYFEEMMRQEIIAAFEDGVLLGYLSYRINYTNEVIDTLPNVYLSTMISRPEARGRGFSKNLYLRLLNDLYPDCDFFTRTWSTNAVQFHIFGKLGFEEFYRIPDDRGPGIDTVYFRLLRDK